MAAQESRSTPPESRDIRARVQSAIRANLGLLSRIDGLAEADERARNPRRMRGGDLMPGAVPLSASAVVPVGIAPSPRVMLDGASVAVATRRHYRLRRAGGTPEGRVLLRKTRRDISDPVLRLVSGPGA